MRITEITILSSISSLSVEIFVCVLGYEKIVKMYCQLEAWANGD